MNDFVEIPGTGGAYLINKDGVVKSVDRMVKYRSGKIHPHKGKILKILTTGYGYKIVRINNRNLFLHRLLMITFTPNPYNKPFVNHIDGNKANNKLENLEWCTRAENELHAKKNKLKNSMPGESNPSSKLTNNCVKNIHNLIKLGTPQHIIANMYNVSRSTICLINKGKNWPKLKPELVDNI